MPVKHSGKQQNALRVIKMAHTLIWSFFVLCILAIPVCGYLGYFSISAVLVSFVMLEVFILVINRLRCPLTGIAARYTQCRDANFDIYLPVWVAKYNKEIFGGLFLAGSLYTLFRWWSSSGTV
jgi:hypothetical protein